MDLRLLAKKLEKSSDDVLVNASLKSPKEFERVSMAVAAASTLLEEVANDMDNQASFSITEQQLDELAALASSFDESNDPLLRKQASVIDELLLSIAAPKNAIAAANKATADEIKRLREQHSKGRREEAYDAPREALHKMENAAGQAKAVEQQVKRFVPMEAPLQTRYPPDRPGGQMTRITDHVYQDIVTGIIYDYKAGYKTQKGNEVPGGSVENQTRELGDSRNQGTSMFESRQSLMGRYAEDNSDLKKNSAIDKIAIALKSIRDFAPKLLNAAIDNARDDGLSTSQIADILASDISSKRGLEAIAQYEGDDEYQVNPLADELDDISEEERDYQGARRLFKAISDSGWKNSPALIAHHIAALSEHGASPLTIDLLQREFLFGESLDEPNDDGPITVRPHAEIESAPTVFSPLSASSKQSLMALALSAIQELAPHLLKSAVAKSKELLTDQQIKSVLSSNFVNKFDKQADEIKIAESLFPHLKDLGWNDLIEQHTKVMSALGISQDKIQKLSGKKTNRINVLSNILKSAGVREIEFTDELPDLELDKEPEFVNVLDPNAEEEEVPTELPRDTIPSPPPANKPTLPPWNPKVKEHVLTERDKERQVKPFTEKHNDILKGVVSSLSLPWGEYISKHPETKLSSEKVRQLETEIGNLVQAAKTGRGNDTPGFEKIFGSFKFKGETMPVAVDKLPKDVKDAMKDMFMAKETTESVAKYLMKLIRAGADFEIIPLKELQKARVAMLGPQNKRQAEELRQKVFGGILRKATNYILAGKNLPAMFDSQEGDNEITALKFTKMLEDIVGEVTTTRRKKGLVAELPEDKISLFSDPQEYIQMFREAQEKFPTISQKSMADKLHNAEMRKQQSQYMEEKGYISPDEKLIGGASARFMLPWQLEGDYGGEWTEDFQGMKNLFENPKEYEHKYIEAKHKFPYKRQEVPKEVYQIRAAEPENVANIPREIKDKIFNLMNSGITNDELIETMKQDNVSPETVTKYKDFLKNSGGGIRGLVSRMANAKNGPVDISKVKAMIKKRWPNADASDDIIDHLYSIELANAKDKEKKDSEIDRWMAEQGFFPPNQPATIGGRSFAKILSGNGFFNPLGADPINARKKEDIKHGRA